MRSRTGRLAPVVIGLGMVAATLVSASAELAQAPVAPPPSGEIVSPSAIGEVRFPHSLHAEELGFDCSDCHHETAASRLRMPHEEYFEDFWIDCRTCHVESDSPVAPQSCAGCHHASPVSTADETLSAKVVVHRKCWECHDSGTGEEASQGCGFCHAVRPSPGEES
jgi:hypothetical protein